MTESARRIAQALDTMTKVHLAGLPCSFNGHISMEGRHVWHVCASVKQRQSKLATYILLSSEILLQVDDTPSQCFPCC